MHKPTLRKLCVKLITLTALLGCLGLFSADYSPVSHATMEPALSICCCPDPEGGGIICQTVNGRCPLC